MKVVCPCCRRTPGRLVVHNENGHKISEHECTHCSGTSEVEAEQFGRGRNISKITAEIAQSVRECRERGEIAKTIAERFGISITAVYKIDSGHTWRENT